MNMYVHIYIDMHLLLSRTYWVCLRGVNLLTCANVVHIRASGLQQLYEAICIYILRPPKMVKPIIFGFTNNYWFRV